MNKFWISAICMFLLYLPLQGQVVTGNIVDAQDRRYLETVMVTNLTTNDSAMSNFRGYFRVKASSGDSLRFTKDGFLSHTRKVESPDHIMVTLNFDSFLLPTAYVFGEQEVIRFVIPNLSQYQSLSSRPAGPGKMYLGHSESNTALTPGMTLDGPISYFTRRERQKRQYQRRLEKAARQQPYLDLINSDSVRFALRYRYGLNKQDLDSLIVEFNLYHIEHEFLDMDTETVSRLLVEFLNNNVFIRREGIW
ncbi:peptidase associated/transthyretin-like domain-containing protein [Pararhodonellum marinum]|uniref:hypothetical protein n=1 Tax=Pararhodonellum marinum TaxID=2755358 RepID=UPI0018904F43|nr:hypothetical protein [Pararhodonellum marinum]